MSPRITNGQRVLEEIQTCGKNGATSDELERRLRLPHQACSPRAIDLRKGGKIFDAGVRRDTLSGRKAVAWVAVGFEHADGARHVEEKIDLRKVPPAQRPAPTSGQSGPPLDLTRSQLNPNELALVGLLESVTEGKELSIGEFATVLFRGNRLTVRNALRRPVRASYIARTTAGKYWRGSRSA